MTAREIIDHVNEVKPNALSDGIKLRWLNVIERRIALEVLLMAPAQLSELELGLTDTPLIDPPYDDLYVYWLEARIDEAHGEYDRYNNSAQMFSALWSDFACFFANRYDPAQGFLMKEG